VRHPARFERLVMHPTVILDGAHNPNGLAAFANAVRVFGGDGEKTLIIGMLSDKDVKGTEKLMGMFEHVIATNIANPRAMAAGYLAEQLREIFLDVEAVASPKEAYQKALSYGGDVYICGSLYLASEIRPIILGKK
jgi:dihydrofolate synthase/folylpolyglutamate synthase